MTRPPRAAPRRFPAFGAPAAAPAPPSRRGASPCIGVCRMDGHTGWCEGCFRTIDEIAAWAVLDEAERGAIWDQLDGRRAAAGD
jgi:predicted Fe-S protein YdhL (DUF1289 family)